MRLWGKQESSVAMNRLIIEVWFLEKMASKFGIGNWWSNEQSALLLWARGSPSDFSKSSGSRRAEGITPLLLLLLDSSFPLLRNITLLPPYPSRILVHTERRFTLMHILRGTGNTLILLLRQWRGECPAYYVPGAHWLNLFCGPNRREFLWGRKLHNYESAKKPRKTEGEMNWQTMSGVGWWWRINAGEEVKEESLLVPSRSKGKQDNRQNCDISAEEVSHESEDSAGSGIRLELAAFCCQVRSQLNENDGFRY